MLSNDLSLLSDHNFPPEINSGLRLDDILLNADQGFKTHTARSYITGTNLPHADLTAQAAPNPPRNLATAFMVSSVVAPVVFVPLPAVCVSLPVAAPVVLAPSPVVSVSVPAAAPVLADLLSAVDAFVPVAGRVAAVPAVAVCVSLPVAVPILGVPLSAAPVHLVVGSSCFPRLDYLGGIDVYITSIL